MELKANYVVEITDEQKFSFFNLLLVNIVSLFLGSDNKNERNKKKQTIIFK